MPSIRGFAKQNGIHYTTVYDWLKKDATRYKPRLAEAFEIAKKIRQDVLIQGGLLGYYNAPFCKFVCINLTDMVSEKQLLDQSISGKDGSPLPELQIIMQQLPENVDDDRGFGNTEDDTGTAEL